MDSEKSCNFATDKASRAAQLWHANRVSHRDNHGGKRMRKYNNLKNNIFMKSNSEISEYGKKRLAYYASRFAAESDEELKATVARENKCRGWVGERGFFLAALRDECEKRGITFAVRGVVFI